MKQVLPLLQAQFDRMCATGKLFQSSISGHEIAETYLRGFGEDPIFRDPQSSVHNCNMCKNFLHRYGNIVAVDENLNILTLFDINVDEEYKESFRLMSEQLRNAPIAGVFVETFQMLSTSLCYERPISSTQKVYRLGLEKNVKRYTREEAEKFGVVKPNEIYTFHHLSVAIPKAFIDFTGDSVEAIKSRFKSDYDVFKRTMEEIPLDTIMLVKDLINQGSLLDGATHMHKLQGIQPMLEAYRNVPADKRDIWCWVNSYKFKYAKFKNELIGVLCTELAEGKELNEACKAMADPYFKGVKVAYAEEVTDETAEDARRYHWCVNDPMRNNW